MSFLVSVLSSDFLLPGHMSRSLASVASTYLLQSGSLIGPVLGPSMALRIEYFIREKPPWGPGGLSRECVLLIPMRVVKGD